MEFSQSETSQRLCDSFATLEWAITLVPEEWTHRLPDHYPPDAWSVAMNVAHLAVYEEQLAVPMLEALADGRDGTDEVRSPDERTEEARVVASEAIYVLLARLEAARLRQIEIVEAFPASQFNRPLTGLWGEHYPHYGTRRHSAAWVATKTFQHTWEHGNAILRVALFAPREEGEPAN